MLPVTFLKVVEVAESRVDSVVVLEQMYLILLIIIPLFGVIQIE